MKVRVKYEYTSQYETVVTIDDEWIRGAVEAGNVDPEDNENLMDYLNDYIFDGAWVDPAMDKETGWGEFDDVEFEIVEPYSPVNSVDPNQSELF